jgi:hypothetical protein
LGEGFLPNRLKQHAVNYTKKTQYEALEKNAVSEPKMPQLCSLKYSRNY